MLVMHTVPRMATPTLADLAIAARVRGKLAEHGVLQAQAAAKLGITQPTFSRRLQGRPPFTLGELVKLAELLGLPLEQLVATPEADSKAVPA